LGHSNPIFRDFGFDMVVQFSIFPIVPLSLIRWPKESCMKLHRPDEKPSAPFIHCNVQYCAAFVSFMGHSLGLHDGVMGIKESEGSRMDAKTLKTVRQRLANEYETLTQLIRRGRLDAEEIRIENTEDEGDLATISHARELFYNLQEGDVTRLRSIEEAMESLDRGQYGRCVRCAEDISKKRLEVMPWARMCIVCQGETEMEASSPMVLIGAEREEQGL